jgi:hypothetical protein
MRVRASLCDFACPAGSRVSPRLACRCDLGATQLSKICPAAPPSQSSVSQSSHLRSAAGFPMHCRSRVADPGGSRTRAPEHRLAITGVCQFDRSRAKRSSSRAVVATGLSLSIGAPRGTCLDQILFPDPVPDRAFGRAGTSLLGPGVASPAGERFDASRPPWRSASGDVEGFHELRARR